MDILCTMDGIADPLNENDFAEEGVDDSHAGRIPLLGKEVYSPRVDFGGEIWVSPEDFTTNGLEK